MYLFEIIKKSDYINAILKEGGEVYFVGGCVRDFIRNVPCKDYDIIIRNLSLDKIEEIIKPFGLVMGVGKAFGILKFKPKHWNEEDIDIAIPRIEKLKEGGVSHTDFEVVSDPFTSLEDDSARRDLTYNALYMDLDGNILDFHNGLEDLKSGIVNTVGKPEDRFREDKLRKIRSVRFTSVIGGTLSKEVYDTIKKDPGLEWVSPERIRDEFMKGVYKSKSISYFIYMLNDVGLLKKMFPNLVFSSYPDWYKEKDIRFVLATLLRDNNFHKVKDNLGKLAYTREEVSDITILIKLKTLSLENAFLLKKESANLNIEKIAELLEIFEIDEKMIKAFRLYNPSISALELMELGFQGKSLGDEISKRETMRFKELLKKL